MRIPRKKKRETTVRTMIFRLETSTLKQMTNYLQILVKKKKRRLPLFLIGQNTTPTPPRGLNLHHHHTLHAWRNTPTLMHHIPYKHAPARGSPYMHHLIVPNHMPQNPKVVIPNVCLYKDDIASPSRCDSLFTTLPTHSFLIPLLT